MSESNCVARRAVTRHEGSETLSVERLKINESAKAHEVADANESSETLSVERLKINECATRR